MEISCGILIHALSCNQLIYDLESYYSFITNELPVSSIMYPFRYVINWELVTNLGKSFSSFVENVGKTYGIRPESNNNIRTMCVLALSSLTMCRIKDDIPISLIRAFHTSKNEKRILLLIMQCIKSLLFSDLEVLLSSAIWMSFEDVDIGAFPVFITHMRRPNCPYSDFNKECQMQLQTTVSEDANPVLASRLMMIKAFFDSDFVDNLIAAIHPLLANSQHINNSIRDLGLYLLFGFTVLGDMRVLQKIISFVNQLFHEFLLSNFTELPTRMLLSISSQCLRRKSNAFQFDVSWRILYSLLIDHHTPVGTVYECLKFLSLLYRQSGGNLSSESIQSEMCSQLIDLHDRYHYGENEGDKMVLTEILSFLAIFIRGSFSLAKLGHEWLAKIVATQFLSKPLGIQADCVPTLSDYFLQFSKLSFLSLLVGEQDADFIFSAFGISPSQRLTDLPLQPIVNNLLKLLSKDELTDTLDQEIKAGSLIQYFRLQCCITKLNLKHQKISFPIWKLQDSVQSGILEWKLYRSIELNKFRQILRTSAVSTAELFTLAATINPVLEDRRVWLINKLTTGLFDLADRSLNVKSERKEINFIIKLINTKANNVLDWWNILQALPWENFIHWLYILLCADATLNIFAQEPLTPYHYLRLVSVDIVDKWVNIDEQLYSETLSLFFKRMIAATNASNTITISSAPAVTHSPWSPAKEKKSSSIQFAANLEPALSGFDSDVAVSVLLILICPKFPTIGRRYIWSKFEDISMSRLVDVQSIFHALLPSLTDVSNIIWHEEDLFHLHNTIFNVILPRERGLLRSLGLYYISWYLLKFNSSESTICGLRYELLQVCFQNEGVFREHLLYFISAIRNNLNPLNDLGMTYPPRSEYEFTPHAMTLQSQNTQISLNIREKYAVVELGHSRLDSGEQNNNY